jgi:hypothetical protein
MKEVVLRDAGGTLELRPGVLRKLYRQGAAVTAHHLRDTLGAIMGSHRRQFLADTQIKLDQRAQGMKVYNVQSAAAGAPNRQQSSRNAYNKFFYTVRPKTVSKRSKNPPTLDKINAEAFTTSPVALMHERGGIIRPRRRKMMAIPMGMTIRSDGRVVPRWSTPAKYKASKSGNQLVALRRQGKPILYAVLKATAKAASRQGAVQRTSDATKKKRQRRVLVPAYTLVPQVKLLPKLAFVGSWDRLATDRKRRLDAMLTNIRNELLLP